MQTQLFWNLCKEIYNFYYMHFFICSVLFYLFKMQKKYIFYQISSYMHDLLAIFGQCVTCQISSLVSKFQGLLTCLVVSLFKSYFMPRLSRFIYSSYYAMFLQLKILQYIYTMIQLRQKNFGTFQLSVTGPTN